MLKFGKTVRNIVLSSSILLVLVVMIFFCDLSILSSLPARQSSLISHATKHILSIAPAAVSIRNNPFSSNIQTQQQPVEPLSLPLPLVPEQAVGVDSSSASASAPCTPTIHQLSNPAKQSGETATNSNNSTTVSSSPQNSIKSTQIHSLPTSTLTKADNPTSIIKNNQRVITQSNFDQRIRKFINNKSSTTHFFFTRLLPGPLFRKRDMMAVERLFKTNPDACLVILSDVMESPEGQEILKPITDKGYRILTISPDFANLLNNTPVHHSWYEDLKSGKINPGYVSISQNLSNLLRLVALYKYGGVYLDTDFIILKSFTGLRNTIGAEVIVSNGTFKLNNAALVFDEGHPLVRRFLEDFAAKFNGNIWGNQGPLLVSRVIATVEKENGGLRRIEGQNFTIQSPVAFYPVDWQNATKLFRQPEGLEESKLVEEQIAEIIEKSYGLHFWNAITKHMEIPDGSVISRLYSGHCIICRDFQDLY